MGFFKDLLKSFAESTNNEVVITEKKISPSDRKSDEKKYYRFLEKRPYIVDFYGRPFDMPAYNDSFRTPEGYKLRELLLLIWWGKSKKGRKSSIAIPKYYFNTYNLNATRLTNDFLNKGLLLDDGEKVTLTEQGKKLYAKYQTLWEIHSFKSIPTNLDIDFPDWDLDIFTLEFYKLKNRYLKTEIRYYTNFIEFLSESSYPESAQERMRDIEMYQNFKNHDITEALDLTEKIEILKDIIKAKQSIFADFLGSCHD